MNDELRLRIERLYSAVGATAEPNVSRFRPYVRRAEKGFFAFQDFRGGLSEAQIHNLAQTAIHNVASLRDHLRRHLSPLKREDVVDAAMRRCDELLVVYDLWNLEKHGGHTRSGGWSGKSPRLTEVDRSLRLSTGPGPNSTVAVVGMTPRVHATGGGSANVVVTGTIVDGAGAAVGDLYEFLSKAVAAWERLLETERIAAAPP